MTVNEACESLRNDARRILDKALNESLDVRQVEWKCTRNEEEDFEDGDEFIPYEFEVVCTDGNGKKSA